MAGNSFLVKGWSVTLIAALVALAAKDTDRSFALICYFPCILFWLLDAYFLSQERKFRSLYDAVRDPAGATTDFGMNTKNVATWKDSEAVCFFRPVVLFSIWQSSSVFSGVLQHLPQK